MVFLKDHLFHHAEKAFSMTLPLLCSIVFYLTANIFKNLPVSSQRTSAIVLPLINDHPCALYAVITLSSLCKTSFIPTQHASYSL